MIFTSKPCDLPAFVCCSRRPEQGGGGGFDAEVPGQFPCSQHADRHVSLPACHPQFIHRPPEGPQSHQRWGITLFFDGLFLVDCYCSAVGFLVYILYVFLPLSPITPVSMCRVARPCSPELCWFYVYRGCKPA